MSGPHGRSNSKFFDGNVVDAEMKAWIGTGVPPSVGSMIRWLTWRLKLSKKVGAGLEFSPGGGAGEFTNNNENIINNNKAGSKPVIVVASERENKNGVRRGSIADSYGQKKIGQEALSECQKTTSSEATAAAVNVVPFGGQEISSIGARVRVDTGATGYDYEPEEDGPLNRVPFSGNNYNVNGGVGGDDGARVRADTGAIGYDYEQEEDGPLNRVPFSVSESSNTKTNGNGTGYNNNAGSGGTRKKRADTAAFCYTNKSGDNISTKKKKKAPSNSLSELPEEGAVEVGEVEEPKKLVASPKIAGLFPPRRHSISLTNGTGSFVEGGLKVKDFEVCFMTLFTNRIGTYELTTAHSSFDLVYKIK